MKYDNDLAEKIICVNSNTGKILCCELCSCVALHTRRVALSFKLRKNTRQAAYEYQELAFTRGRIRRQRSTLSTGLFCNCGISFRG